jgi:hypothetical protein
MGKKTLLVSLMVLASFSAAFGQTPRQLGVDDEALARIRGSERIAAADLYPAPFYPPVYNEPTPSYPVPGPYDYGYLGGYGYVNPWLLEPCRNFPGNRRCVMGKIKINLSQTLQLVKGMLSAAGLSIKATEVDMYSAKINETDGKQLTVLVNNGPITKHNNWFNGPFRLEAGVYVLQFVTKTGQNVLFEDRVKVFPEYFNGGDVQHVQVSAGRFNDEPVRAVIEKEPPKKLSVEQWRNK